MKKLIVLALFASVNMQINAQSKIGFYLDDDFDVTGNPVANYGMSLISGVGYHYVGLSGFFGLNLYTNRQERLKILRNGYVGIGNTKPTALLNVGTSTTNSPSTLVQFGVSKTNAEARVLSLINSGGGANQSTSIDFHNRPDWSPTGKINVRQVGNTTNSALHFYTFNSGLKNRMTINEHGKVGIGTNNPKAHLSIEKESLLNLDWTNEPNWGGNSYKWSGYIGFNSYRNNNDEKDYFFRSNNYTKRMAFEGGNYGFRWLGENEVPDRGSYTSPKKLNELMILTPKGNAALYGKFEAKEIKVTTTPTADFVFEKNYNLPSLKFIDNFITNKKHLPEIASAKEMKKEGVNIGEFQIQLLQKIEELTLYTIAQEKKIDKQHTELKKQELQIKNLQSLNKKLVDLQLRIEKIESNK